jgi:hypothetical protein
MTAHPCGQRPIPWLAHSSPPLRGRAARQRDSDPYVRRSGPFVCPGRRAPRTGARSPGPDIHARGGGEALAAMPDRPERDACAAARMAAACARSCRDCALSASELGAIPRSRCSRRSSTDGTRLPCSQQPRRLVGYTCQQAGSLRALPRNLHRVPTRPGDVGQSLARPIRPGTNRRFGGLRVARLRTARRAIGRADRSRLICQVEGASLDPSSYAPVPAAIPRASFA